MKDVHSMIGADAVIQGNITCKGSLAVFGKVYGDVTTEGIGPGGPRAAKFMGTSRPATPRLAGWWTGKWW